MIINWSDDSLTPVTVAQWELRHDTAQSTEQLRAVFSGILHQLLHIKTIPRVQRRVEVIRDATNTPRNKTGSI